MSRHGLGSVGMIASAFAEATARAKSPGVAPFRPATIFSSMSAVAVANGSPRRDRTARRPTEPLPRITRKGFGGWAIRLRFNILLTGDNRVSDGDFNLFSAALVGGGDDILPD